MEWVETTGRTIEEAKNIALDQLGVAEDDADFEVVDEPKPGLFGRTRGEARVRARVRPTSPRGKGGERRERIAARPIERRVRPTRTRRRDVRVPQPGRAMARRRPHAPPRARSSARRSRLVGRPSIASAGSGAKRRRSRAASRAAMLSAVSS